MSAIDPTLVGPDGPSSDAAEPLKVSEEMAAAQGPSPAELREALVAKMESSAIKEAKQVAVEIIGRPPTQAEVPTNVVPGLKLPGGLTLPPGLSFVPGGGITLPGAVQAAAPAKPSGVVVVAAQLVGGGGISLPGAPGIVSLGTGALPATFGGVFKDEPRADLIWGPTGSGKSVQVGWAIYYIAKFLKKKSLVVTADGGAVSAEVKALQELGLVDILPLLRFKNPLAILDNLCQGYWPLRKASGEWTMADPAANHQNDKAWYEQVGGLFFESGTSIGDYLMPWLTANPEAKIPGAAKEHKVTDGDKTYGFAGMAHYGFLGDRFYQWISWSAATRYDKVLWTAREQRSQTDKGMVVIGPDFPGKAITQKAGGWFGGCYHMSVMATGEVLTDVRKDVLADSMVMKGKGAPKNEHRMYIVKHPDPETGIMCDVKNRLAVERVLKLETPYITCEKNPSGPGGSGISTMWGWESETQGNIAIDMKDDLQETMKALKMIPDVTQS